MRAVFAGDGLDREVPKPVAEVRHFAVLDYCRGAAIILVFVSHCPPDLASSLNLPPPYPWHLTSFLFGQIRLSFPALWLLFALRQLGGFGVAMFFVVSGFCIYQSYTQTNRPEVRTFFIRRFFRIYPPYLLTLLIFAVVFPLTRLPFNKVFDGLQMIAHLLLCHNLSNVLAVSINPAYWSLAVEVQLYALFPFLLMCVRRLSSGRVLLLLAVIEVTMRSFALFGFAIRGHVTPAWVCLWPWSFWFSWSTGAAIADAYFSRRPLPFTRVHPLVWLAVGLIDGLVLTDQFSFTLFALFTASLISRWLRSAQSQDKEGWVRNFVRRTGVYSYSIYLIHVPVLSAILLLYEAYLPRFQTNPFSVTLAAASGWLVVFPMAALMYCCVEKPGIAVGKGVIRGLSSRLASRSGKGGAAKP